MNARFSIRLIPVLLMAALFAAAPSLLPADDLKPEIDKLVEPVIKGKTGIGIVVGIMTQEGHSVLRYGQAAFEDGTEKPPDGSTLYEIGSITKVFTALLLADMTREGLVKLDDPVRLYLPEDVRLPKHGDREITLLHLVTHTSGLPIQPPGLVLFLLTTPLKDLDNPYRHYGIKNLHLTLNRLELKDAPGTKEDYSNLGMGVLGYALARRANMSYEELVVKRICEPLGMKDTRITLTAEQQSRFPKSHDTQGKPTAHWEFQTLEGAGALRSTAEDMLLFLSANMGRTPDKLRGTVELCQELHAIPGGALKLPLGWQRGDGQPLLLWHNGGTYGSHSFAAFCKEQRAAVIVLCNRAFNFEIDRIGTQIVETLAPLKGGKRDSSGTNNSIEGSR